MIKRNLKRIILSSVIILLPILVGLLLWHKLPDMIPTHFGPSGAADGWSSKNFAVLFIPLFLLAVHLICIFATSLDPKHKNISDKTFGLVLWICPLMSVLIGAIMYIVALGYSLNVTAVMMLFTGALFIVIGNYLPKCRQNYTIGIKIPWTLSDDENWNATHRFAGILWVLCGILLVVCSFLKFAWIVFICMVSAMVICPIVYSYLYYKKNR